MILMMSLSAVMCHIGQSSELMMLEKAREDEQRAATKYPDSFQRRSE